VSAVQATAGLQDLDEAAVLALSEGLGEPEWLRDRRLEALKAFTDLEWPTNRTEEWRYTNPKRFDLTRSVVTDAGQGRLRERGIIREVRSQLAGAVHLVDGGTHAFTVCAEAQEQGVIVTDFVTAAAKHPELLRKHLGTAIGHDEKFDALSLAGFTTGAFVYIPADVELDDPIAVNIEVEADGAVLPRVLVVFGTHAKGTVYVDHYGAGTATVVEALEVVVSDGAQARVVTAQDWGDGIDHIGSHTGLVLDNADYKHLEATFGGRTVYIRPNVRLDRPGGNAELLGVYFATDDQRFEHRSLIHHNASKTTSDYVYKGALQGTSRATWFGNIRIEPHARATASDETNRNLILSDGAKADTIPFLEIFNSDVVRCGHHSSVGQVDELQLFYLESRGIPREEAARLLVFGFFAEVTDRIDLPGVTAAVLEEIESEIRSGPTSLMDPRRSA
jgi:Fe-S cluster assembly protein SufD